MPTTAKPAPPPNPPPVTITAALEMPAGFGFRASIEDSTLQLEQDRADEDGTVYTHSITLSAAEAARIVDWIAEQVAARCTST